MRKSLVVVGLFCTLTPALFAVIPPAQRIQDLQQLAALYAKTYGPYEWKKAVFGYDLFDLQPWKEKALAARTDLEYLDVLIEYTSSLKDGHVSLTFPFPFDAYLGFDLDIYDGRVLIDAVDPFLLDPSLYPFQPGDELVSLDGLTAEQWLQRLARYSIGSSYRANRRRAAQYITWRPQTLLPWAHEIGEEAEVVIRRASGAIETYQIPWDKFGEPVTEIGPVPTPFERVVRAMQAGETTPVDDSLPAHLVPLAPWMQARAEVPHRAVRGYGSRIPYFGLPDGFQTRLGMSAAHAFYTGVYESGGHRIGYVRIPSFGPSSATTALQQLDQEIAFFNQNTDGLIVDVTRNPGGSVSYLNEVCRRLIPYNFRSLGFEVRATAQFLASFNQTLSLVKLLGFPPEEIEAYQENYDEALRAYRENRGMTKPLPLTSARLELEPVRGLDGTVLAYQKPLIVLVDEFSASGGDAFPATMQDNERGLIVGMRTMGLGGTVSNYPSPSFTEGIARSTTSLMNRKNPIKTDEFPEAPYVENIGVRPDVELDYMIIENLRENGRPFVNWFTEVMLKHIRGELPTN